MQLTGPAFLFLFLPLSLLVVFLIPKAHRRMGLSLLSVLWYVLANADNLIGLAHIAVLVFFTVLMVCLPPPRGMIGAKLRVSAMVIFALISFLAARLLLEYGPDTYQYPAGLLFVTLSAISYAVDLARGDTFRPRNPLDLIGYLLFFPVLTMGPALRSKEYFDLTENIGFVPDFFCFGVRKYMLGTIKRLAVAAVVLRAFSETIVYTETSMHPVSLLLLLSLSFVGFYFAVTGAADMARGVCAMYGIPLPRDRSSLVLAVTPDRTFYGVMISLRKYLSDYLLIPLSRRLGGKGGRVLCTLLLFVCTVFLWRTRPEMLLFALPVLVFSFLCYSRRVRHLCVKNTAVSMLFVLLAAVLCTPLTLALALDEPLELFAFIQSALHTGGRYPFHGVFSIMQDARYLVVLFIILILLLPYAYFCKWLRRHGSERLHRALLIAETVLLFIGFAGTLIYFAPQFPLYGLYGMYYM